MARRDFATVFGRILRERRLARNISQEDLAHAAEIHRTHVGLIERGQRSPSLDVALAIAVALEERLATLVEEAERRISEPKAR